MSDYDEEDVCSACNEKIFWLTKSCCIYSCYNFVCSKCRYCEEHYSLKQLRIQLANLVEWWKNYSKDFEIIGYGLYTNDKNSLENEIHKMEASIANGFKLMQQVHGKRLPDDVSKLITSFLY